MMRERYADRDEAGRVLAASEQLAGYVDRPDVVALGLPRGGVPVAAQVAATLRVALDVLVVRKLGLPGHAELAMGAIAGVAGTVEIVRNDRVLAREPVPDEVFVGVYRRELHELREREARYREGRAALAIRGRVAILVDDGLATGSTMRAAIAAVRSQQPASVVVAVPVGARETCDALQNEADEVVCAWIPDKFVAVGQAYVDFDPPTDDQIRRALAPP